MGAEVLCASCTCTAWPFVCKGRELRLVCCWHTAGTHTTALAHPNNDQDTPTKQDSIPRISRMLRAELISPASSYSKRSVKPRNN